MLNFTRKLNEIAASLTTATDWVTSADAPVPHVEASNVIAFPQTARVKSTNAVSSATGEQRSKPVVIVLEGGYNERQRTLLRALEKWKQELAQSR